MFDGGQNLGYGLAMTDDARRLLQEIIDYCSDRWTQTERAPDHKTGKKTAYNDVFQFARRRLGDLQG